jgi:hypothetical protein
MKPLSQTKPALAKPCTHQATQADTVPTRVDRLNQAADYPTLRTIEMHFPGYRIIYRIDGFNINQFLEHPPFLQTPVHQEPVIADATCKIRGNPNRQVPVVST